MKRELHDQIVRKLVDEGRLMEAGFVGLRLTMPKDASQQHIESMRMAFFAGADHVFHSIMGLLEPEGEPTENDMRRLTMISLELEEWKQQIRRVN